MESTARFLPAKGLQQVVSAASIGYSLIVLLLSESRLSDEILTRSLISGAFSNFVTRQVTALNGRAQHATCGSTGFPPRGTWPGA